MTYIPLPSAIARQYRAPREEPDEWSEARYRRATAIRLMYEAGIKPHLLLFVRWRLARLADGGR